MTIDEIKTKLAIDDAEIRLSVNGGWYWVSIMRFYNGVRASYSGSLPLASSEQDIAAFKQDIDQWWTGVTSN